MFVFCRNYTDSVLNSRHGFDLHISNWIEYKIIAWILHSNCDLNSPGFNLEINTWIQL